MRALHDLNTARWTVEAVGDLSRVPASVLARVVAGVPATLLPEVGGCIHTDLMDAGLIPDPAVGMNEEAVQWVSWTDWCYECVVTLDAVPPDALLHFDRLDTIASVEINGTVVGTSNSEFVPWAFPATSLRVGDNTIRVTFTSPLRHAYALAATLGLPHNGDESVPPWHPYNMLRKCASNFGWDWGPKVATCGLGDPALKVPSSFDPLTLCPFDHFARFDPATYTFSVNGRPVFIKGVNWIPEGLWPRDRTRAKIRARLLQAKAMGCNLIRVWGGGRYESDAFYETCDELGLMVWQDFMFACACYPEEAPFPELIEAEARHQVARLSKHPCVVLWCGGNENHWAYESWGFKQRVQKAPSQREGVVGGGFDGRQNQDKPSPQPPPSGRGWGARYWHDLLPKIVAELSPNTPYVPDSPWSPPPVHPNDAAVGDRHTWDLFGPDFLTHVPRFCSEFGVQSPSNLETLREAGLLETGSLVPPALVARQRGPGGMARWYDEFFAKAGIPPPSNFEAWHAAAQGLQADWLFMAIVWLRLNQPACGGGILWQLNDAWPGFSWSLIDSAGRKKPASFAVQRAFADRVLATLPAPGGPLRVAINDTDEPWEAEPGWIVGARGVARRPA